MKKLLMTAVALPALLLSTGIANSDPVSASIGWFSSTGFQSSYSKSTKDLRANLIKKAESGFYDGFDTYYTVFNSTTIGAQVVISDSEITAHTITVSSCGNISSQNSANSAGNNDNSSEGDITCTTNGGSNDN